MHGDDIVFASSNPTPSSDPYKDIVFGDNLLSNPLYVSAGTRRDELFGEDGKDFLAGQDKDDIIWPGSNVGGPGQDDVPDTVVGGMGDDTVAREYAGDQNLASNLNSKSTSMLKLATVILIWVRQLAVFQ